MIKNYEEMRKVDVSKYTEERDGMEYLNWARCIDLLHSHGAEKAYFEPITNADGSSLFKTDKTFTDSKGNTNSCYEVEIKVIVDDNEWIFRSPLMNGANPVKDNSMSQQRVWNCQTRAFVKCVAIHTGLGFNLWLKEAVKEDVVVDDDLFKHDIMKVKERFERLLTLKMDAGLTLDQICEKLNIDKDQFNIYLKHYKILNRLEETVREL